MRTQIIQLTLISLFLFIELPANTLSEDPVIGYRGYLPYGWVTTNENDSSRVFIDTSESQKRSAVCYVTRFSLDGQSPQDWTRSFFIAQKMIYDYSAYYFSHVVYYDSSSVVKQQSSWAPEIFARCYSSDTSDLSWDEYVYYTAINGYGYEFLAIGDTTDMETNIDFYSDFLHGLILKNGQSNSSNFLLSNLETTPQIQFTENFTSSIGKYFATVGIGTDKMSIVPFLDDPNASIKIQGNTSRSGVESNDVSLIVGENSITLDVTAADNTSIKTYSLMITRLSTEISVRRPLIKLSRGSNTPSMVFDLSGRRIFSRSPEIVRQISPGMYIYKTGKIDPNEKKVLLK
jgi:hypothetical protein